MQRIREASGLDQGRWPPRDVAELWGEVEILAGLRGSDEFVLRSQAAYYGMSGNRSGYVSIPLPRLIARAKANLLFGEAPRITAEEPDDLDLLSELVEENDLPSELHRGAVLAASEGDVFGKVTVQPDTLDYPIIEFVSRAHVIPTFAGRFLTGATFVTEYAESSSLVWRRLETHGPGYVETLLYRGSTTTLGQQRNLSEHPATDGVDERVLTPFPDQPMVVFIPNTLDDDPTRGVSDYLGLIMAFFALNESTTVGQANVRTTALNRVFAPRRYRDARGNLPAGDVFFVDERSAGLGEGGGPISVAQYQFQASELTAWIEHVYDLALQSAGIAPASLGRGDQGNAASGTALRLKMSHTLMEAAGSGRYWDRAIRRLLRLAAVLDQREFGRPWAQPDALPAVQRGDGLPRDPAEDAGEIASLRSAEALSIEQAVRRANPDWSDDQVQEEVARIQQESPTPAAGAGGVTTPTPTVRVGRQGGLNVEAP